MKVSLCRHLKTNGVQCKSPALEYSNYCFFHDRLHERHKNYRFSKTTEKCLAPGYSIKLHALEDAESIQVAISVVVNAIAVGTIRDDRARMLLYGLQLASLNARRLAPAPKAEEVVRAVATTDDGLTMSGHDVFVNLSDEPAAPEYPSDPSQRTNPESTQRALPAGTEDRFEMR